jgi:phosphatidylserine/phosphatidylglycerophosphate/cardiolipin synthase-like enzyme
VVIANAYFFPGYRLLREIRNAARRGVEVRLILQGQPDMLVAKLAARMTYDYLLKAGCRSTNIASARCTAKSRWWMRNGARSARAISTR